MNSMRKPTRAMLVALLFVQTASAHRAALFRRAHARARTPKLSTVGVYTSELCIGHNPGGPMSLHPEKPERLEGLLKGIRGEWQTSFGDAMKVYEPDVDVTEEQLRRVHTQQHIDVVADAFARAQKNPLGLPVNIDSDTLASKGSQAAATRAAGLVIAAVDRIFGNATTAANDAADAMSRAFVAVRPPGHHAEHNRPMGFCLYNNVMVGVAHAQKVHGVGKIAILDFDVHHGNGDADITASDPTLLYASSHQSPCYPGTGTTPGREGPHNNVISCPLPPGAASEQFRGAWLNFVLPLVAEFEPEAIFISAGFDAHGEDPLASLALTDDDFSWITEEIVKMGKPIVSVLEGGYNVEALERAAKAHVGALIRA